MANRPITIKIDVTKIEKRHLYTGKERPDGTQPKYLNVVVWKNKDGPDQFGNTHFLVQDLGREAREAGERGAIIGNLTMPEDDARPAPRTTAAKVAAKSQGDDWQDDSEIPF